MDLINDMIPFLMSGQKYMAHSTGIPDLCGAIAQGPHFFEHGLWKITEEQMFGPKVN